MTVPIPLAAAIRGIEWVLPVGLTDIVHPFSCEVSTGILRIKYYASMAGRGSGAAGAAPSECRDPGVDPGGRSGSRLALDPEPALLQHPDDALGALEGVGLDERARLPHVTRAQGVDQVGVVVVRRRD